MSHIAMTGANGFLGWHTRAAAQERNYEVAALPVGKNFDVTAAAARLSRSGRFIHAAGVNRGTDVEVAEGNLEFARQASEALCLSETPPRAVVFANSTQAENESVYGVAKRKSAEVLRAAAEEIGAAFIDVKLPNLFGEHGRPFYNAVTATFSHLLALGETPVVENDKELTLLHAQNAADLLLGAASIDTQHELEVHESVSGLLYRLSSLAATYRAGEIPDVAQTFDRDLFNTYRSYTFHTQTPIHLTRHADARGSFFEIIRSHGGCGQSSFSTTQPGVSRGDHYHRRKIERFTVLSGEAVISLRRLFTEEVFEFAVAGEAPVAIDMPTMWSHQIRNTADTELFTSFWSNDIFDPAQPDTIAENVHP